MAKNKEVKKAMVLCVDVPYSQTFLVNNLWAAISQGGNFPRVRELCEREDMEVEVYLKDTRRKRSLIVIRTEQEDSDRFVFAYNPGSEKLTEKMYESLRKFFDGLGLEMTRL